jgi:hypothetical protein
MKLTHMIGFNDLSRRDWLLFGGLFFLCILAKGGIFFQGYAVDDYTFAENMSDQNRELFFSQGRFIAWLIVYLLNLIGVNPIDITPLAAFSALTLQAALAVSAIRFIGYSSLLSAFIAGATIVLHPFSSEVLTFKIALPNYCFCALFLLFSIEAMQASRHIRSATSLSFPFVFALISVMTYQSALNYLLVIGAVGMLASFCFDSKDIWNTLNLRSSSSILIFVALLTGAISYLTLVLAKAFGLVAATTVRASLISSSDLFSRAGEVMEALEVIYLHGSPVVPKPLAVTSFIILSLSATIMMRRFFYFQNRKLAISLGISLSLVIPFLTIGVAIVLRDWWPAPRVLSHYSFVIGMIMLVSLEHSSLNRSRISYRLLLVLTGFVLLGYMAINNQIFVDQKRLNQWDAQFANRLMTRIEGLPNAGSVRYIRIIGGNWSYPEGLRTTYMDMNISAFSPQWSRDYVMDLALGTRMKPIEEDKLHIGKEVCKGQPQWPRPNSIRILEEVAVVCLPN